MSLQLTLPRPSAADQEIQLTSLQILYLVKIFLNASLGCICCERRLLPQDSPAFLDRRVEDLALITTNVSGLSYREFISFQGQLSVNDRSQPFKILARGKDHRADHLLRLMVRHIIHAWNPSENVNSVSAARPAHASLSPSLRYSITIL